MASNRIAENRFRQMTRTPSVLLRADARENPFVSRALKNAYKAILKVSACDCEQDFTVSVTPLPSESSASRCLGSYGIVLILLLLAVPVSYSRSIPVPDKKRKTPSQ